MIKSSKKIVFPKTLFLFEIIDDVFNVQDRKKYPLFTPTISYPTNKPKNNRLDINL